MHHAHYFRGPPTSAQAFYKYLTTPSAALELFSVAAAGGVMDPCTTPYVQVSLQPKLCTLLNAVRPGNNQYPCMDSWLPLSSRPVLMHVQPCPLTRPS